MNKKELLRQDYLYFLKKKGKEQRPIPENWAELNKKMFEEMQKRAIAEGDEAGAKLFDKYLKNPAAISKRGIIHPIEIILQRLQESVENSINKIDDYKKKFRGNIFVGEFPTGSVNAEAVSIKNGYLALINSGLIVFIKAIVETLNMGPDWGEPIKLRNNKKVIGTIAEIVHSYLYYSDPMFGPLPLSGGTKALFVAVLSSKCEKFILAHEYGHIIAGHLKSQSKNLQVIPSRVGNLELIKKNWNQEFEADLIAYKIILETDDLKKLDLSIIDLALEKDDQKIIGEAVELKCALIAPLLFFTIQILIERTASALQNRGEKIFFFFNPPSNRPKNGANEIFFKRYPSSLHKVRHLCCHLR